MRNTVKANLDNAEISRRYDTGDMLGCISAMPELCETAWQAARSFELPHDYRGIDKVVILGMGGSAIGGDLIGSLVAGEARLPIILHRDYNLPAFVDGKTLMIASSYSGATEETLSAFTESLKTDARKLALTSGGKLKNLCLENGIPFFNIDYQSQPRAALPFSIMPVLCFLGRLGITSDKTGEVNETVSLLRRLSQEFTASSPLPRNEAKRLACKLYGRIAVIYGAEHLSQVAHRWKTQLNENGKAWAFYEVFPELNHNSVVGYEFPRGVAKKLVVVMLTSPSLYARVKLRYDITGTLLSEAGVKYEVVESKGESTLSQVMSTVLLGDYVSYYLAVLNGVDPTPTRAIDYLKGEMGKIQDNDIKVPLP